MRCKSTSKAAYQTAIYPQRHPPIIPPLPNKAAYQDLPRPPQTKLITKINFSTVISSDCSGPPAPPTKLHTKPRVILGHIITPLPHSLKNSKPKSKNLNSIQIQFICQRLYTKSRVILSNITTFTSPPALSKITLNQRIRFEIQFKFY